MLNKFLSLVILLVLAGCQAHSVIGRPVVTQASTHPANDADYHRSAAIAVQSEFYDADSFKGRTCNLQLHQVSGQMPDAINTVGGDPALCAAAIEAIKKAIEHGRYPVKPSSPDSKLTESIPLVISPH
ncbi:cell envelope integrity TolA C-terminal domain-containing protein [Pantoea ananatis]|uniref:cell envelope integrity TolA C-terminal domain-containing protein n=1 Tax=Pantoea ananas TaxID=553 RepID=UPI001B306B0C|nr:cell envelope integrity TolA C-terminal domain-containing protein [Pantoea ananatis]